MALDKNQDSKNALVVRVSADAGLIEELSGGVSADHLWLTSVNGCRLIANLPLDNEETRVEIDKIDGEIKEYLRRDSKESKSPSAIFQTIPTGKGNQRYLALLFSSQ
jgi:hypothetical protein